MHYTSWDREDTKKPRLLREGGPEELAVFDSKENKADVAGETWQLSVDKDLGASATLADGREFRASGKLQKDKSLKVSLNGRSFEFINEAKNDWIVDDAESHKVAQFTGAKNGVRKAILEFEDDADFDTDEAVALSWFARLTLESRLDRSSVALISTLVLLTIVAVLVWVF